MPEMGDPLYLDWCSHDAAKYAAENWHYSECLPPIKNVYIGVWEHGEFIGSIVFSRPASARMGDIFDLGPDEFAELSRVALTDHEHEVSRITTIAIRMLEDKDDGLDCLFSYADPVQGHEGGIYQAMNWIYLGRAGTSRVGVRNGEEYHRRTLSRKVEMGHLTREQINQRYEFKTKPGKHKYVYPLIKSINRKAQAIAEPYP
jgi:hypothetical protein